MEGLLALAALLAMGGVVVARSVPPDALVVAGVWISAAGLAFGVPTGLVYHVALHRSLRRAHALPPGWWWRPTALHDRLPEEDRTAVLLWCGAGATGFLVTVAGMVVMAAGAIRML